MVMDMVVRSLGAYGYGYGGESFGAYGYGYGDLGNFSGTPTESLEALE
jgi:hypothetical protein